MLMVLPMLLLEKALRRRKKYSYTNAKVRPISPKSLTGIKGLLATGYCLVIFAFSFLIPTLQLSYWSFLSYKNILDGSFWLLTINSLGDALVTTWLVVCIAGIMRN